MIYKGFENLDGFKKYLNRDAPNLVVMVFVFGLIHGFGLSTRLQQIALGHENVILKIISFNVGVEIGQIAVLTIIYPGILFLRGGSFGRVSKIVNTGLIIAGMGLFYYQINGYFLSSQAPIGELSHDDDHGDGDHHHNDHSDDSHHDGDDHVHQDHFHGLKGDIEQSHGDIHKTYDHEKVQETESEGEHHNHSQDHHHESTHPNDHLRQDNGKLFELDNQSPHRHDDDKEHDHGDHEHSH